MINLGLCGGRIGGIFITGIFGNFYTKRGEFLTFKTGIPGGLARITLYSPGVAARAALAGIVLWLDAAAASVASTLLRCCCYSAECYTTVFLIPMEVEVRCVTFTLRCLIGYLFSKLWTQYSMLFLFAFMCFIMFSCFISFSLSN